MRARGKEGEKKTAARLVILDSHAILHRAYHAIPDFSTSKGEPTGALYGLTATLLRAINDLKPDFIVATRDLPGKTNRHKVYEEYKAKRVKAEPELIEQLGKAPEVFKAFGIPVYAAEGFEADDCIGTIVKKLKSRKELNIIIVTGDLDTLQLVSEHVKVYTMRKGITDTLLYDEGAVQERFGFPPERMVDYKALRGDPSDNIPGIRGIGEKTATELIREFGSLKDIYRTLKKDRDAFVQKGFKARIIELLESGRSDAEFSKELVTIHTDAPIEFVFPGQRWTLKDHVASISTLCDELEFRALKERVREAAGEKMHEVSEETAAAIDPRALSETSIALWLLHSDMTNPSLEDILHYAQTDDFERAREVIFAELRKTGRLNDVFEKIERPLIPVVERMNETGIFVDVAYLKGLSREYSRGLGEIAGRIFKHAGREFNINSPKQLATVLFDELKIVPARHKRTATGARTTRESELAALSPLHPIIGDILAYRELQKLLSTYIEKMPALVGSDGRLHTEFLQAGTTTGRMASQDPNLQNIPIKSEYGRRIRTAFAAEKGFVFAAIDYSQIELRVAAGLAGDHKLIEVFKKGGDVHAAVASEVFNVPQDKVDYEKRRRAKVINFGILYGMGVNALKAALGEGVSRDEAANFLAEYFRKYAGLARFIEKTKQDATKRGYTETLFGRRRYFPGLQSALPNIKAQAERMAMNAPIQGTQSDIMKLAMIEADKLIEKKGWRDPSTGSTNSPQAGSGQAKARLILQVHDELVYEVEKKDAEAIARALRDVMEHVVPPKELGGVPIVAEVSLGPNWGEVRKAPR
ncbi:hypothetical protein A2853_03345 [Candidatus Kaiserbacteria bacterium RIFCSPHIGHO2_01_FULL_55_17]|uniref:DNA-directed DNA polymerase n=1 Tax=Candidatus Kaiserbacteria bacterium RIFCSPHIGHO2_01_FULL_55_17 TaxID=1798484 RepID=A0A1F6D979_9BACT|nr:MAG: hypothetical protein A2853_03345 [Candidatus Kaiserbacteria bacterium RIFCSPHIGHO2_01_FULL_55_17]